MTFDTLLLPTDGSDPAEAAASRGLDLAEQLDATVHVLSVADSSVATGTGYSGDSASIRSRLRDHASTHVASLQEDAETCGLDTTAVIREGIPAKEIVDYADANDVDGIVMGTAGRGGVARAVVGSVTDKVLRTASVPVITISPAALDEGSEGPVDSVLVPTDGSSPAETAADRGISLAARLGATVHLLSVVDDAVTAGLDSLLGDRTVESTDHLVEQAGDHLGRVGSTAIDCGVEFVTVTVTGDPADEIVSYATEHDVDMIAMGTRGRGGFERLLLGSVTDDVVRTAPVPVLTVRAGELDE